jgi:hypothetical protein
MTSQLNVDTIVDKAGSGGTNVKVGNTSTYVADGGSATQNIVQGLCKAWADAENDATRNDSFNIASGTDNGTGDYVYAFTNVMNSALYVTLMSGSYANITQFDNGEQATTSYTVRGFSRADSLTGSDHPNHSGIFGDLA